MNGNKLILLFSLVFSLHSQRLEIKIVEVDTSKVVKNWEYTEGIEVLPEETNIPENYDCIAIVRTSNKPLTVRCKRDRVIKLIKQQCRDFGGDAILIYNIEKKFLDPCFNCRAYILRKKTE